MTDIDSIDLSFVCKDDLPELQFILPGFLKGTVGSIVSSGGLGKTMFALQVSIQKTSGYKWFDFIEDKLDSVVYLSSEDQELVIKHRIKNLCRHMSSPQVENMRRYFKVARPLIGQSPSLFIDSWRDKIKRYVDGCSIAIIDTLRRFHGGEENSSVEMTELVSHLEKISQETNCSILFLHHVSKMFSESGNQQSSRGSSVLIDNIRWSGIMSQLNQSDIDSYNINKDEKKFFVKFGISKNNYSAPFGDIILRRSQGGIFEQVKICKTKEETSFNPWRKNGV